MFKAQVAYPMDPDTCRSLAAGRPQRNKLGSFLYAELGFVWGHTLGLQFFLAF